MYPRNAQHGYKDPVCQAQVMANFHAATSGRDEVVEAYAVAGARAMCEGRTSETFVSILHDAARRVGGMDR